VAEFVRTAIGPAHLPTNRTLDERLFVRWPTLYAAFSRAGQRLPRRSRLRRALLRRSALSGWGAFVRGDFDLMFVRFAPNLEYNPPREWLAAGMRSVYRDQAGLREWAADMRDAWEWIENQPLEVLDAGDVLVFRNKIRLRAVGSGIEFDSTYAFVMWIEEGLIVRESDFSDWDEALRTAGISPA
jgi:ketosteroid isomerase-like protein